MCCTDLAYAATRCAVLTERMLLQQRQYQSAALCRRVPAGHLRGKPAVPIPLRFATRCPVLRYRAVRCPVLKEPMVLSA
eukprot:3496326-Rhodomonas_salina.5